MSLLSKKYNSLKPTNFYLCDRVILAQAWKKAHQYIRSTNWYADTFELDRSAVDLDGAIAEWVKNLESESFTFDQLRIVPAPKADRWDFIKIIHASFEDFINQKNHTPHSHSWQPKNAEAVPLRPLAHVSIRDQTLNMALMMCMADIVETIQGDTSTSFQSVHESRIVNYGNRLHCVFKQNSAKFSWGNSTTYSKYFSDYQKFLERPLFFGAQALQQKIKDEQVFEIKLDIEKFYDCVNRFELTKKIRALCDDNNDPILARLLTNIENWQWESGSEEIYDSVCKYGDEKIPMGIPQGLVIGGFLANIYLIDFDKDIFDLIDTEIADGIRLIDYCRYVDDMRLIVIAKNNAGADEIKTAVENTVGKKLSGLGLRFNENKTQIDRFRYKRAGISTKLKDIQNKISGPLSSNEIDEQLGHLEGLIGLADSLRDFSLEQDNTNPLATIEMPSNDVRDDTILRFSANKIHTLLKQKRSLIAQDIDEDGNFKPGSWDYLQERMARKFISCWSKDPSLVLLLKKGLELFPDKRVLKPVLDQLREVLDRQQEPKQIKVAEYCIGEIFRHAATTIHTKESWNFPAHAEIEGFFEHLQSFAVEIITND